MSDIDPAAVMAAHQGHTHNVCENVVYWANDPPTRCKPYRLAEALIAEQAKVTRVEALLVQVDESAVEHHHSASVTTRWVRNALAGAHP